MNSDSSCARVHRDRAGGMDSNSIHSRHSKGFRPKSVESVNTISESGRSLWSTVRRSPWSPLAKALSRPLFLHSPSQRLSGSGLSWKSGGSRPTGEGVEVWISKFR